MGLTATGEWNKIATVKGDDDREKHIMGVAYNNILDGNLALEEGFKSAAEFVAAKLKQAAQAPPDDLGNKVRELSVGMLSSYGVTARAFSAEDFSNYGQTALYNLLRYCKVANIDPKTPLSDIRVNLGGEPPVEKPFAECTIRELRAAIAALRTPAERLEESDEQKLELLNLAVDVVVGAKVPCDVKGKVRNGKPTFDLVGVPLDQAEEVLWSMLEALQES